MSVFESFKRRLIRITLIVPMLLPYNFSIAEPIKKPFKRVLVMSGGGLNPGSFLGMIHGGLEMGWKPDLIITSCGSSLGSVLYNSDNSISDSFKVLQSHEVYSGFSSVQVNNAWVWDLLTVFDRAANRREIPNVFSDLILTVPQYFPIKLKNDKFLADENSTKILFVGSKSLFNKNDIGKTRSVIEPLFKVVYFTDSSTAKLLDGYKIQPHHAFPYSNVVADVDVKSDFSTLDAYRASIADPFLLEPFEKDGEFYFTGAVDLYPIKLAQDLGEEVIATYPQQLYTKYEVAAIEGGFAFSQNVRALEAIQNENISWIDVYGLDALSFNPQVSGLQMVTAVPIKESDFRWKAFLQWDFGRNRIKEALNAPKYSSAHLRRPISKKLYKDFSCKNAFTWKTPENEFCESDTSPGCNRNSAVYCIPLR